MPGSYGALERWVLDLCGKTVKPPEGNSWNIAIMTAFSQGTESPEHRLQIFGYHKDHNTTKGLVPSRNPIALTVVLLMGNEAHFEEQNTSSYMHVAGATEVFQYEKGIGAYALFLAKQHHTSVPVYDSCIQYKCAFHIALQKDSKRTCTI